MFFLFSISKIPKFTDVFCDKNQHEILKYQNRLPVRIFCIYLLLTVNNKICCDFINDNLVNMRTLKLKMTLKYAVRTLLCLSNKQVFFYCFSLTGYLFLQFVMYGAFKHSFLQLNISVATGKQHLRFVTKWR